jgi:type III secretion system YscD/HrpQ family protein
MSEPTSASPSWCVRFLAGAVKGRTIALHPGPNMVGSAGECDVMLPGGDVQPRHLIIAVGELMLTVQRVGTAAARLNGEEMTTQRRSLVAGDVVSLGKIEFQIERIYPSTAIEEADPIFAESSVADDAPQPAAAPVDPRGPRWYSAAALAGCALGLLGLATWNGLAAAPQPRDQVNVAAVQKAIVDFPEVDVVASPDGQYTVRGRVESYTARDALLQALKPFAARIAINVQAVEEILEQARRYVNAPEVQVAYVGQGRLVMSGNADDDAVRTRIRRLGEDLHPTVTVSDRVVYGELPQRAHEADLRSQWDSWQSLLPARLVSITEDGNGTRHIQLANGSRYYEGAMLRPGLELKRIDGDGMVVTGPDVPKATK